MSQQALTISLPGEMVWQVDEVRRQEHRTRSELIREALRVYLGSERVLSEYAPSDRERRALTRGRAAIRKGQYYTLDEFRNRLLGGPRQESRRQKTARRSSPRA